VKDEILVLIYQNFHIVTGTKKHIERGVVHHIKYQPQGRTICAKASREAITQPSLGLGLLYI